MRARGSSLCFTPPGRPSKRYEKMCDAISHSLFLFIPFVSAFPSHPWTQQKLGLEMGYKVAVSPSSDERLPIEFIQIGYPVLHPTLELLV